MIILPSVQGYCGTQKRSVVPPSNSLLYTHMKTKCSNEEAKQWILSHIVIDKITKCWKWTYAISTEYNRAKAGQHNVTKYGLVSGQVSRSVYALWYPNDFDPKLLVLHGPECPKDSASQCVNPKHLHQGTSSDNQYEKFDYGNGLSGTAHPKAKFTKRQVKRMKRLYEAGHKIPWIARTMGFDMPLTREDRKKYDRMYRTLYYVVVEGWQYI